MPSSPSRRRFLKQSFGFSAAALLGQGSRWINAEEVSASSHHFLMIGDWGAHKDWKAQEAVAGAMKTYVENVKLKPEAMFLLGDNFYGSFKGGTECPRWKTQFEDMYPADVFPGPCYAMLGNHDYDDERVEKLQAELDYANVHPETRWKMPAKWYTFDYPAVNPVMKVIVVDSNYNNRVVSLTDSEKAEQKTWLEAELAKSRPAPWLVVMGHHPLYTNGKHGDSESLIERWEPLFKEHKVDFYFCGHDHDMQHIEFENHPTSFVISGGGGARTREIKELRHGPYGEGIYGFSHLEVSKDTFVVRHLDANRKLLHAFTKTRDGKVMIQS